MPARTSAFSPATGASCSSSRASLVARRPGDGVGGGDAWPRRTPPARFVDLGCGIGTVLMLLAWRFPDATRRRHRGAGRRASTSRAARSPGTAPPSLRGPLRRLPRSVGARRRRRLRPRHRHAAVSHARPRDRLAPRPVRAVPLRGARRRRGLLRDGGAPARARRWFVVCAAAGQHARVVARQRRRRPRDPGARVGRPRVGKDRSSPVYDAAGTLAAPPPPPARLVVRDGAGQWTAEFAALRAAMGMPGVPQLDDAPGARSGSSIGVLDWCRRRVGQGVLLRSPGSSDSAYYPPVPRWLAHTRGAAPRSTP